MYNFQRVSDTQFLIQVPDIESSGNHIVVYMTGEIPFPEGFAGAGKWYSIIKENFSSK